jgi:hypothetical protein
MITIKSTLVVLLLFASPLLVHAGELAPTGKVSDEAKQLVEKELAIFAEGQWRRAANW